MASGKLTREKIEAFKGRAKPYRKSDGGGLYIQVQPNGSKLWRLAYRFGDPPKQKTLSFGAYDAKTNGLLEARNRATAAKLLLKEGRDPGRQTLTVSGDDPFRTVALDWLKHKGATWSADYASTVEKRLESYVFPDIGHLRMGSVKRSDIMGVLRKLEDRGTIETAHRVKQYIGSVFRHCDADSIFDPTPSLKGKLKPSPKVRHHKRLRENEIGKFLAKLDDSACEPTTRLAILFTIFTAARTQEIIGARWDELENTRYPQSALWRLSPERMKKDREHLIPLNVQALAIIAQLQKISGKSEFLFPSAESRTGHMSNNTMLFHCYAMGYRNKTTMHGWRGAFSTIANESGRWEKDWIEVQLSHAEEDKTRAAYNSALYLPKRRELMAWWGDRLDAMRLRAKQDERYFGD